MILHLHSYEYDAQRMEGSAEPCIAYRYRLHFMIVYGNQYWFKRPNWMNRETVIYTELSWDDIAVWIVLKWVRRYWEFPNWIREYWKCLLRQWVRTEYYREMGYSMNELCRNISDLNDLNSICIDMVFLEFYDCILS